MVKVIPVLHKHTEEATQSQLRKDSTDPVCHHQPQREQQQGHVMHIPPDVTSPPVTVSRHDVYSQLIMGVQKYKINYGSSKCTHGTGCNTLQKASDCFPDTKTKKDCQATHQEKSYVSIQILQSKGTFHNQLVQRDKYISATNKVHNCFFLFFMQCLVAMQPSQLLSEQLQQLVLWPRYWCQQPLIYSYM